MLDIDAYLFQEMDVTLGSRSNTVKVDHQILLSKEDPNWNRAKRGK